MSNPRVLVISPDLPYPIRAGGQMRIASMVQALGKCASVHVACIAPELPSETKGWCDRIGVSISHFLRSPKSLIRRIGTKLQVVLLRDNLLHYSDEQQFFDDQIKTFQPDLIWLETPYQLKYALKHKERIQVLVDYWGLAEGSYRDYKFARGIARLRCWIYWKAAAHAEAEYARKFKYLASVSTHLNQQLKKQAPQSRVWAIPNGIIKTAETAGTVAEKPNTLVMTGDYSFGPNIDAARYFTTEIFPRIKATCPQAEVRFVGRDPAPEVQALAEIEGVAVTGFVEDVMKEIACGSVYILPLRMGSGIRSKLFDVFPLAKPIVLTSVGAEGLEFESGVNCMMADQAEAFAAACIRLLQDEAERQRLGRKVKRLATEVYTQENIDRMVAECVTEITRGGR